MDSNDSNNNKVEKHFRGWNRKDFRWDKDSEEYKKYLARHKISRSRADRRRLEALAKAPLFGRIFKPILKKYEHRKRTKTSDS